MSGAFDPVEFLESAVPLASNEDVEEMRSLLVETLESNGVEATVDDAGNTLAAKGEGAPHVVLNTHIDTVSPHVPYEREEGVIRGRGACDAKGPLAALLSAFLAVDPAEGRVTVAITPDEEVISSGAAALDLEGDCYVVGEPTGLDACHAAKGRFEGTLALSGVNAHAAEPESGVNPVAALEEALGAVRTFDDDREDHPTLGPARLTPTAVEGGESTNQVPARCALVLDRRSVPPETAEKFRESLESHVRAYVPEEVGVSFSLIDRPTPFLEAFDTPRDHELVQTLADAATKATDGEGGAVRPFSAATEAAYFSPAPTVVFGPGDLADEEGAVAHSDREYVRTDDVERAATAVTETLCAFVG